MTKKPQDLVYELTNEEIQRLFVASDNGNDENEIKLEELKRKHFTYKELMFFADKLDDVLIETTQTSFDDLLYEDQIQNAQCALEVLTILQNVYKRTVNAKQRIDEQVGVTQPKGQIHFKTSKAISGVNFFEHDANDNYDFSVLQVYINDELTDIPANSLTANAGDDIRIVSRSKPYPFFRPSNKDYIASIEEPLPFMGVTDFNSYFSNCTSLISIPAGLFDNNPNITNFGYCFENCTSLMSIPSGLFDNTPNVTDFGACFCYCGSLTDIPEGLFDNNTKVTNFDSCFSDCTSLTSIPAKLFNNNTKVTDFSFCFNHCSSLMTIPKSLFDNNSNVTNFGFCFSDCRSITTIPAGLFDKNTNVTDFRSCFYYCNALTSIPTGLFNNNPNVNDFSNCFGYCTSLTTIPKGLFDNNPSATDFNYCFNNCRALTSIPAGLFDNNPDVTDFSYCFNNCSALTSIPQDLFDKNTKATDFICCFSNCTKLTINVQIGSTTTNSIHVGYFAHNTVAKGTVYCRVKSNAYDTFLESTSANVNALTY